jgi:hypothetical protein
MNEIPLPLRRILDGHKKEELQEVGEEGTEKEGGQKASEEGGEKEAHAECCIHEADAAG